MGVVTAPQQEGGPLEAAQPIDGMRGGLVVGGVDLAGEEPAGLARLWGAERLARTYPLASSPVSTERSATACPVLSAQRSRAGRDHAQSTTLPTTESWVAVMNGRSSDEGQLS